MRWVAVHERLCDAAYHWASVAAQRDPISHDEYRALRARGHGHAPALRSVADRPLHVTCAMLRDDAPRHRSIHVVKGPGSREELVRRGW